MKNSRIDIHYLLNNIGIVNINEQLVYKPKNINIFSIAILDTNICVNAATKVPHPWIIDDTVDTKHFLFCNLPKSIETAVLIRIYGPP